MIINKLLNCNFVYHYLVLNEGGTRKPLPLFYFTASFTAGENLNETRFWAGIGTDLPRLMS